MLPGRPIISDEQRILQNADLLDFTLNPLSTIHPSYIRTQDFIQKVKEATLELHSLLFTMDINDLYTNIGTNKGL